MHIGRVLLLPLGLLAAGLLAADAQAQGRRRNDPVVRLERWVRALERSRSEPTPAEEAELHPLCADLVLVHSAAPERGPDVAAALLTLACARPAPPSFASEAPLVAGSPTDRVQALARDTLARLVAADPDLARWLAGNVLARTSAPLAQRVAAARALEGLHLPPTLLGLLAGGLDPERALRDATLAALVGWADDAVHRFLVGQLRRNDAEPGWIAPREVRRHFGRVQVSAQSEAERELGAYVRAALLSTDWRRAYRGTQLAAGLPDEAAVPDLIAALRAWIERRESGQGRLRLEEDLARELRRRSGRNIGAHPERWTTWWRARQAAGDEPPPEPDPAQATTAGFFGLRPVTDRVVFVLDRSGSMENAFQGGLRTRYEEATEQLLTLLESLGPDTRFRVILFSGEVDTGSEELRPASKANLGLVRSWMRYNGPGGATHLRPAVEEALRVDRRGRVDLQRLEADTVIVLCDGATAEGPGWVEAFLAGPNEAACMLFHSVQIGAGGDGTLERLAEESGGDFARVRG